MAENVELTHECCHQHLNKVTARMNKDKETVKEDKYRSEHAGKKLSGHEINLKGLAIAQAYLHLRMLLPKAEDKLSS